MSLLLIACINNSSLFCTSSPVYPLFRGTPGTRKQTSLTINTNPFAILLLSACPFLLERLSRIFRPDSSEQEAAAAVEPGQISGRSAAAARFLVRLLLFSYSNGLILYIRFLRVCVWWDGTGLSSPSGAFQCAREGWRVRVRWHPKHKQGLLMFVSSGPVWCVRVVSVLFPSGDTHTKDKQKMRKTTGIKKKL